MKIDKNVPDTNVPCQSRDTPWGGFISKTRRFRRLKVVFPCALCYVTFRVWFDLLVLLRSHFSRATDLLSITSQSWIFAFSGLNKCFSRCLAVDQLLGDSLLFLFMNFQTKMAFRLLAQPLKRVVPLASRSATTAAVPSSGVRTENEIYRDQIGSREIVGFGFSGAPAYADRNDYPLPAIRWREDTPEIKVLREKEKGDWRKLTKQEKKALYRASFCQTFAEFNAPTGEWKLALAGGLAAVALALWISIWLRLYGT